MSKWSSAYVGDFFELVNGYAFKSSDFVERGVPVIKIKNVKAGEFSEHDFSFVSPSFLQARSDKIAQLDDLLISMSGNRHDGSPETWVGKVAHFRKSETYLINQRIGALRVKSGVKIDVRFAGFLLSSFPYQELFISIATSSGGQANLSPHQILSAPIRFPDLETQQLIGETLGVLNDKIALNRQNNETLNALVRAIFKDWFVDFGPTRAKIEGREPYLAPDIWAHFPDRFDEKMYPIGWELCTLRNFAELNPESWSTYNAPELLEYVDLANTKWGTIEATEFHQWGMAPSRARRVLRPGDTIVGTVRPGNGSYSYISRNGLTGSTGFAVLRPQKPEYRELIYCAATSAENIEQLAHLADGGAYPAVRPDVVASTKLWRGAQLLIEQFSSMVCPLFDLIEANKYENHILAQTRDFLLPKLMSGELGVENAEKLC